MAEPVIAALQATMRRITAGASVVANLERLSGGANMESWSFDMAGQGGASGYQGYILRRAPTPEMMAGRPLDHALEAAIIRTARAAGVCAPEIVGELTPADGLGTGYVMRRVEARVSPTAILAAPPPKLLDDLAHELAKLHALPLTSVPQGLPHTAPAALVAELHARFTKAGSDRPVMALALRWLQDHLPIPMPPVFLHGDYRLGNVMVDQHGLAAVLDWELAHLGDRHQDLAYGCINSWRFGQIDKPAFGLGDLATYWAAYERASGVAVDAQRFRFWMVYATLWWGLTCLHMAQIWRSGQDKSLERAVIGRRASETEVDLLLALEEDAPECERGTIEFSAPDLPPTKGEPDAAEMLAAVADWVATSIKPQATGRDRFMAAVAQNALGMLAREAANPVAVQGKTLSEALLAGTQSLATPGLLAKLKQGALAKLAVDQPKYPALAKALERWRAP